MKIINITGDTETANFALTILANNHHKQIMTGADFTNLLRLIDLEAAHISLGLVTFITDVPPALYKRLQALAKTFGDDYIVYVVPRG